MLLTHGSDLTPTCGVTREFLLLVCRFLKVYLQTPRMLVPISPLQKPETKSRAGVGGCYIVSWLLGEESTWA